MRRRPLVAAFFCVAALLALAATACLLAQGGFGWGHGALDRAMFALALPWSLIPWPAGLVTFDFVWLVLMLFLIDVTIVATVAYLRRSELG